MQTLSIDIETYSDVSLSKCGVYKYAESPDFEVLLFGYSTDGSDVTVIDLAQGERLPQKIIKALTDDTVIKWAFNANFKRVCLSRYLRNLEMDLDRAIRNGRELSPYLIGFFLILYYNLREHLGGKVMRTFNYSEIKNQKWDSDILGLIAAIYKEAGKQELYLKQRPQELEKLVEIAKIQSTEASNAIEGIVTTNTRIRQLVEEKTTPRNRDEQEIAGYRDALNIIHESFDAIPITQNYILQLHKILYSHMNNPMAGKTKSVQNYISATYPDGHVETLFTPLAPYETPEAMDRICEEYNRVIGNMEVEPLIVIPIFIHDFLCIHPFNDGNGRMSRLLTTLLLYRNGFYVGKYISLEAKIAKNKDLYYDALGQAQIGWHEGTDAPIPFIKYLLGTILAAYHDFEARFALVEIKLSALETVRRATMNKIGRFTKQDIRELCPSLSISSVEGALRKLVASGELKREGRGKNICYYRLK